MIPEQVTPACLTDESRRRTRDSLLIFKIVLMLFPDSLKPEFTGSQTRYDFFIPEMFRYGLSYDERLKIDSVVFQR
jgi:hypothetical protein